MIRLFLSHGSVLGSDVSARESCALVFTTGIFLEKCEQPGVVEVEGHEMTTDLNSFLNRSTLDAFGDAGACIKWASTPCY